ncbi:hypothetical protein T5B8_17221 [Salinisphaera sp. T5B8]|uniref:nucleotidyltransferase domain-containing protein n=1 Tax=Salinisphaera sp. T5B8 TaxID=1304154 RepID=UPI0033408973
MRLTDDQRNAIREEVTRVFGPNARVRLFGSRVDDAARGGDIDLYIESEGNAADLLDQELRLHARLLRRLGERRIDIVVHDGRHPLRSIDAEARRTGVPL